MIEPHITFVFLVQDFTQEDFIVEIKKQVEGFKAFSFTLRCAVVNKDSFTENFFTFLVPDDGYSNVVKLHDRLYDDKLFYHRRLDIDFIPHILIATSADSMVIKKIADEWNAKDFEIKGRIGEIQVISFENGVLDCLHRIKLA
jgi:hypothetical protein